MAAVSDNDLTQAKQWLLLGGKAATSEVEERIEQHIRNKPLRKFWKWLIEGNQRLPCPGGF
ncbi:hypothetical protein [Endozoicomonas sp. ONNA2]|uniref:hypothetical protein n=1 Tax=Endozoicomonas sp. ONNA2 TaxID=2828741 RepID=UPI002149603D|nr:hypothetical protein [Endozoicomonas sp. ONNA2]